MLIQALVLINIFIYFKIYEIQIYNTLLLAFQKLKILLFGLAFFYRETNIHVCIFLTLLYCKVTCTKFFKNQINSFKQTWFSSIQQISPDRYKLIHYIDGVKVPIFIHRNPNYKKIVGIYANDFSTCVTDEIKPYLLYTQDQLYSTDFNEIKPITIVYEKHNNTDNDFPIELLNPLQA